MRESLHAWMHVYELCLVFTLSSIAPLLGVLVSWLSSRVRAELILKSERLHNSSPGSKSSLAAFSSRQKLFSTSLQLSGRAVIEGRISGEALLHDCKSSRPVIREQT